MLTEIGLGFRTEVMFENCRGPVSGRRLKFDFYIPTRNLLIEFDGEQHFKPVSFGASPESAQARFEMQVVRDKAKDDFARESGILLIRLRFDDKPDVWQKRLLEVLGV